MVWPLEKPLQVLCRINQSRTLLLSYRPITVPMMNRFSHKSVALCSIVLLNAIKDKHLKAKRSLYSLWFLCTCYVVKSTLKSFHLAPWSVWLVPMEESVMVLQRFFKGSRCTLWKKCFHKIFRGSKGFLDGRGFLCITLWQRETLSVIGSYTKILMAPPETTWKRFNCFFFPPRVNKAFI